MEPVSASGLDVCGHCMAEGAVWRRWRESRALAEPSIDTSLLTTEARVLHRPLPRFLVALRSGLPDDEERAKQEQPATEP